MRNFHALNKKPGANSYAWTQVSASGLPSVRDGAFGFSIGSKHYICLGWISGNTRYTDFYQSVNLAGTTWSSVGNIANTEPKHTVASFITPSAAYFVNGDIFNIQIEGAYQKDSHKFNGTSWTRQAVDAGAGEFSVMGAAYHDSAFYLIGGQKRYDYNLGNSSDVYKSTNDCVSFSNIGSHPFDGGNLWGSLVSFNGKLWKIGGGQYWDGDINLRTYPTQIYSSTNGTSWTNEGTFPGAGRQYHQTVVFDNKIWVIGGFNHNFTDWNRKDVWYSSDGVNWTELTGTPWLNRHAHTCWVADNAIWMFGGSASTGGSGGSQVNQLWKLTIT
jgi:hypothetical protein